MVVLSGESKVLLEVVWFVKHWTIEVYSRKTIVTLPLLAKYYTLQRNMLLVVFSPVKELQHDEDADLFCCDSWLPQIPDFCVEGDTHEKTVPCFMLKWKDISTCFEVIRFYNDFTIFIFI